MKKRMQLQIPWRYNNKTICWLLSSFALLGSRRPQCLSVVRTVSSVGLLLFVSWHECTLQGLKPSTLRAQNFGEGKDICSDIKWGLSDFTPLLHIWNTETFQSFLVVDIWVQEYCYWEFYFEIPSIDTDPYSSSLWPDFHLFFHAAT